MLSKVRKYIAEHRLLGKDATHIVALSGGADSVCLLRIMLQLGYTVHGAHCNFHLRGAESDRDENFCKQLCEKLGVPLHLTHFDTKTYSELHKVSIEMAARQLRYTYFEQLRIAIGAESIVVAHHSDDNVETVLMNIIRGTGIHGLEGIKPRNGHIIRPLLCLSRSEITDYLTVLAQPYVTDSSNLVDDVVRNKIRLTLIPMLESINPAAKENINRTARNVAEAVKVIDAAVDASVRECVSHNEGGGISFTTEKILAQPSPEQTLFKILTEYDFTPQQIRQIYENISAPSGRVWLSSTHTIASDRGTFLIEPNSHDNDLPSITIPESGVYIYNKVGARISVETTKRTDDFTPSRETMCATLDADKVRFPLTVRKAMQGDSFCPFGMKGKKLISDYLTDRKRSYFQKKKQLVVEDADGNIIWLIGERTSQKASCTDNTIKILTLRYLDKPLTQ